MPPRRHTGAVDSLRKPIPTTTSTTTGATAVPKKKKKAPYKDIERRREQNRVNAQKSYYRKLNILETLRSEVAVLEDSYKAQMRALKSESLLHNTDAAVASRHASYVVPLSTGFDVHDDDVRMVSSHQHQQPYTYRTLPSQPQHMQFSHAFPGILTTQNYRRQLQQLAAEHDALTAEHRQLQAQTELFVKFQCRAQLLTDAEPAERVAELFGAQSELRRARVLANLRTQCPAQMQQPLSVDECYAMGRDVYRKIATCTDSEDSDVVSTDGAVCGWTDRRRVDDGLLKFSLTKRFANASAHAAAARTWPVLTSPAELQALYSPSMKMHCEVAQVVDDHNVVIYQEYEALERDAATDGDSDSDATDVRVLVRSLLLVTLFQIPDGYVLLFVGIDPQRLQVRDDAAALASVGVSDRRVWLDKLTWCLWQDVRDDDAAGGSAHCKSSFVGAVPARGASSRYWSVEVLLLAMRWEHAVIGPTICLTNSDDSSDSRSSDEAVAADKQLQSLSSHAATSPRSPSSSSPSQTDESYGESSAGSWSQRDAGVLSMCF